MALEEKLQSRTAEVGVLGLGYAGLPGAVELARAGFRVTGLDIDESKVQRINAGESPVPTVSHEELRPLVSQGLLRASRDFALIQQLDAALICVPTPLTPSKEPDLRFVGAAVNELARRLHRGMLIILESTGGVGATRGVVLPALAATGLRVGEDFFLAFAPERIDPGNKQFGVRNTPKLVGGITPRCTTLACWLYRHFVHQVFPVSSPEVAEMAKLVENTFRFINIGFVNEIACLCDRMGLSVWEVMQAAATKPFAFMPHFPGPGVGGHCIPIAPFYLEAAAKERGLAAALVEVAGRINEAMPGFVVAKLERLLAERSKSLAEAKILVLGVAYKPNLADMRESPALKVMELLLQKGAAVSYHDPFVPQLTVQGRCLTSEALDAAKLKAFDSVLILTPHDGVDYGTVVEHASLIFDTRNALAHYQSPKIVAL